MKQKVLMNDVTPSVVYDHPNTTIMDDLQTDITMQTFESLLKKEPTVEELAGPSEHQWIKIENSIEESQNQENNQTLEGTAQADESLIEDQTVVDDQEISMHDVAPRVVDEPHPHTTFNDNLENDITVQTYESLFEKEPAVDEHSGPFEHKWIKIEKSVEEAQKQENNQTLEETAQADESLIEDQTVVDDQEIAMHDVAPLVVDDPHPHTTFNDNLETDITMQAFGSLFEKGPALDELSGPFEHKWIKIEKFIEEVQKQEKNQTLEETAQADESLNEDQTVVDDQEISMHGVAPCVVDDPQPHTTFNDNLETDITIQTVESLVKKEPAVDELAGPSEHKWIKIEKSTKEVQKRENNRMIDKTTQADDSLIMEAAVVDEQGMRMNDITSSFFDDPHPHTIKNDLETDMDILTGESLMKKEPAVDELEGALLKTFGLRPQILLTRSITNRLGRKEEKADMKKRNLCSACIYCSTYLENLTAHVMERTGETSHVCDVCEAKFKTSTLLKKHQLRTIHGCGLTEENCSLRDVGASMSGDVTTLENDMQIHMGDKRRYACNFFGLRCSRASDFNTHKRTHVSLDDQDISMDDDTPSVVDDPHSHTTIEDNCETDITIQTVESLVKKEPAMDEVACSSEHDWIKVGHSTEEVQKEATDQRVDVKKLHCFECKYTCDNVNNLKVHVRIHKAEKPYACDICGAKFKVTTHLNRHKLIHSGGKPYMCGVCESKFCDLTTLENHVTVHTGEKPYVCGVCKTRFTQVWMLNRHKRTHTGRKLIACNVCGLEYSCPSTLKKHFRKHTSLDGHETSVDLVTSSVVDDPRPHTPIKNDLKTDVNILTGESLMKKEPAVDELAVALLKTFGLRPRILLSRSIRNR